MLTGHIYWIIVFWAVTGLLGVISLPFGRFVFRFSSDRGWAFSKIIGLIAVSYIAFTLATLKLAVFNFSTLIFSALLWLAFNAGLFFFKKEKVKNLFSFSGIVAGEIIFLAAFSSLLIVKSFQPEIYQIERFMDFGFIQAMRNSGSLPLEDIWFSGAILNYYYFGHVMGAAVLILTGVDTIPGFFLLGALIFGLLAASLYRLGVDLSSFFSGKLSRLKIFAAGAFSLFGTLVAGTWYMIPWLWKEALFYFGYGKMPYFFYPESTRVIPGTITEMPIYSFIVADIHAHVWGMLSGILILAILYSLWRNEEAKINFRNFCLWALAFVLGLAFMINSWDALSLGVLSLVVLAVKFWKTAKMRLSAVYLLLPVSAYLFALPWGFFNKAPVSGVGFVKDQSPLWPWLSFWGSMTAIVSAFYLWKKYGAGKKYATSKHLFVQTVMYTGLFFLALIEIVYAKDILLQGEWFRANTVFKITIQVWLWLGVFLGPVFIWIYSSFEKKSAKVVSVFMISIYVLIGAAYPVIAVKQSYLDGKKFTGVDSGLMWWQKKYPDDYSAYLFLKDLRENLPRGERLKRIVEAEGDSYTDVSRFSVFLGWPTIVGWPVHEWTWRGSYDEVAARRSEVREIYTGLIPEKTREILGKYNVDFVIIGEVERAAYAGQIQEAKLKSLGEVIFEKGKISVIKYNKGK